MHPKLSICIPSYNRAVYLKETLDSIFKQLPDSVEVVVSDNASTDNTLSVLQSFGERYPQMRYSIAAENGGADRNYLRVVDLAHGDYCWLFGSDDILKPGAINMVLNAIDTSVNDLLIANITLCDQFMSPLEDHRIYRYPLQRSYEISNREERLKYFYHAHTTTAFFSFLGSLIFKRNKWIATPIRQDFIGSLWIHVTKIFDMMPDGLRIGYIHQSLLNKRGDNDSFMDLGVVNRYRVAVEGYERIAKVFFGTESCEARHIRRTLCNELTIRHLLNAKLECYYTGSSKILAVLDETARILHQDERLESHLRNIIYKYIPISLYGWAKLLNNSVKKIGSKR